MVTWRAMRLIIFCMMVMALVMVIGAMRVADFSPTSLLARITDRGEVPSPTPVVATPAPQDPRSGSTPVIPAYPPVVIAAPSASVFATGDLNTASQPLSRQTLATGGNCLMNDNGSRVSILPDCPPRSLP